MRLFPEIGFLRRMYNRDAEIKALDRNIAAAPDIADPGERLLRYEALEQLGNNLSREITRKLSVPAAAATVACIGLGMVVLGCGSILGLLALPLCYASLLVMCEAGADGLEALKARRTKCVAMMAGVSGSTDAREMARSSCFDQVMTRFPGLKEKFLLAAVRDLYAGEDIPAPPPKPAALNL